MNLEKPYQPSEEEMKQAEETMTDKQKKLSVVREKWMDTLAEKGLTPEEISLEVYIYRKDGGYGYSDSFMVSGTVRGKEIRMEGYYTGGLPHSDRSHSSLEWRPDPHNIHSVEIDGEKVQGEEAQKIASKLLPLVAPYTKYAEFHAKSEIRKHDEWVKGAGEREEEEKKEKEARRLGEEAQENALNNILNHLENKIDRSDIKKLARGEHWGSDSYSFKYEKDKLDLTEEEKNKMTKPQQDMSFDRETWLGHLDKLGLAREKINLKFEKFYGGAFSFPNSERNRGMEKCIFTISGDINGLDVLVKGSGQVEEGGVVRGYRDVFNPSLEEVKIGDQIILEPKSYGGGIAYVLDGLTEPNSEDQERKHFNEVSAFEQAQKNKEVAKKSSEKIDDLLGGK